MILASTLFIPFELTKYLDEALLLITLANEVWYVQIPSCPKPCRVGSVGSVSASRTVGREFASRPGHTKDHHKNGTNCLPAWHAMR